MLMHFTCARNPARQTIAFLPLPRVSSRRTCSEAAAFGIAQNDCALSLPASVALKLNLLACKTRSKFEDQVLTMRAALSRWLYYCGNPDVATANRQQAQREKAARFPGRIWTFSVNSDTQPA